MIEYSLKHLSEHKEFDFKDEDLEQPLLPNALKIEKQFIKHAIAIIKASQDQKDVFSGDSEQLSDFEKHELELIEKDVLLFRGKEINGTRNLV